MPMIILIDRNFNNSWLDKGVHFFILFVTRVDCAIISSAYLFVWSTQSRIASSEKVIRNISSGLNLLFWGVSKVQDVSDSSKFNSCGWKLVTGVQPQVIRVAGIGWLSWIFSIQFISHLKTRKLVSFTFIIHFATYYRLHIHHYQAHRDLLNHLKTLHPLRRPILFL